LKLETGNSKLGNVDEMADATEKTKVKRNASDISLVFSDMSHFRGNERFEVKALLCWQYPTVGGKDSFASDCRLGEKQGLGDPDF
jgi:hypothetical protein